MFIAEEMPPQNDSGLKSFILNGLAEEKYPNLLWLDERTRLFKLSFSRYGSKGCWKEHEQILQDYEEVTKLPYEGYSKARASITSTLKSSVYFKMIKEIKDGYIFQFRSDLGGFLDDLNPMLQVEVLQTENDPSESCVWTRDSIVNLIECFRAHRDKMQLPHSKKKNVWFSICEMMKEREENITPEMCYSKWRNMKRTYTINLEKNRQPSESEQQPRWEYFDTFHDIYRGRKAYDEDLAPSSHNSFHLISFVDPAMPCNSSGTIAEVPTEDSDQKERNAIESIKRCLQEAHLKNCTQVKKLRMCIEQANKISSEKNCILKDTLKERNLILKKYLGEKNDILKELLETQDSAL